MDRIETLNIICNGGLDVSSDLLQQGIQATGTARRLINYEPENKQGYTRILGYTKFDSDVVPGDADTPVLGVQPCFSGALAARKDTSGATDNAIYYSTGSGWTQINSAARGGSPTKVRFEVYNYVEETVVITDGANPALKYNGATDTLLNGTGAPAAPKYAAHHSGRLVLAEDNALFLSAPADDEDFSAASGAILINVGDKITNIRSFREVLYIFCENSIRKLVGNSSSNFRIDTVTTRLGCTEPDTILEIAGDLLYLTPQGFRSLAATERIGDVDLSLESGEIEDLIQDAIDLNPTSWHAVAIPSKSQYRVFYYQTGLDDSAQKGFIGRAKYIFIGSQVSQGYNWAEIQGMNAYCANSRIVDGDEVVLFGHPTDGYVYQMESGGSFDGANVSYVYRTPPLVFNDVNLIKVLHRLRAIIKADQDVTITVRAILDEYYDESIQPTSKFLTIEGDAAVFGGAGILFDAPGLVFASDATPQIQSTRMEGAGSTITIEISGSDTSLPHTIDNLILEYATKGRRTTNE